MNIFYLHSDPNICAKYHCDKHVVKMILEYAQLLSTAHRIIDGTKTLATNPATDKEKTFYLLPGETISHAPTTKVATNQDGSFQIDVVSKLVIKNPKCYYITHQNHPSAVWVRANRYQYEYVFWLFTYLLEEYEHRYRRKHKCTELLAFLREPPKNILATFFQEPPLVMPDEYKVGSPVASYREFYNQSKSRFATWTGREVPHWYVGKRDEQMMAF